MQDIFSQLWRFADEIAIAGHFSSIVRNEKFEPTRNNREEARKTANYAEGRERRRESRYAAIFPQNEGILHIRGSEIHPQTSKITNCYAVMWLDI